MRAARSSCTIQLKSIDFGTAIKNMISSRRSTLLVDDRIYNQYTAIESGAHPIRMRCEFTTDLPSELSLNT